MLKVNKSDFYYGSLLSVMLSNGVNPALFEESHSGRVYVFSTNKGNYQIYMKYVYAPTNRKKKDAQLWQFNFSPDEIELITSIKNNGRKTLLGLICGKRNLKHTEIAVLNLTEAESCLGIAYNRNTHRITVKYEKGVHGLKIYGTGRTDILDGADNTIKISRDFINTL